MNTRLFLSTFVLIFLAELGDKTQLAAMAQAAAGVQARWSVFVGASAALVLSTLMAVLFGSELTRLVPASYIKGAAGTLFIVAGVLILARLLAPAREAPGAAVKPGVVTNVVFRVAADFERATVDDYRKLAASARDGAVRALLLQLADDEAVHLERVRAAKAEAPAGISAAGAVEAIAAPGALAAGDLSSDRGIVAQALAHERATVRFYEELAKVSVLPGVRRVFGALAREEAAHVRRLEAMQASG